MNGHAVLFAGFLPLYFTIGALLSVAMIGVLEQNLILRGYTRPASVAICYCAGFAIAVIAAGFSWRMFG